MSRIDAEQAHTVVNAVVFHRRRTTKLPYPPELREEARMLLEGARSQQEAGAALVRLFTRYEAGEWQPGDDVPTLAYLRPRWRRRAA